MKGIDFKKQFDHNMFYMLFMDSSRKVPFVEGLNFSDIQPNESCQPIQFYDKDNLMNHLGSIKNPDVYKIANVEIVDTSDVDTVKKNMITYFTNVIEVLKIHDLIDFPLYDDSNFCKALINYTKSLCPIPKDKLTDELCNYGLELDIQNARLIPQNMMTAEMCSIFLAIDEQLFVRVPDHLITLEMCNNVMDKNCNMFNSIPTKFKTIDMCKTVLMHDPSCIKNIPIEMFTEGLFEYYLDIVNSRMKNCFNVNFAEFIKKLPKEHFTDNICQKMIEINGNYLSIIPEDKKKYVLCLAAVACRPEMFHHVPEKYRDYNMCNIVTRQSPYEYKYVPLNVYETNPGIIDNLKYINNFDSCTFHEIFENIPKQFHNDNFYNNIYSLCDKFLSDHNYVKFQCIPDEILKKYPQLFKYLFKPKTYYDMDMIRYILGTIRVSVKTKEFYKVLIQSTTSHTCAHIIKLSIDDCTGGLYTKYEPVIMAVPFAIAFAYIIGKSV